MRLKANPQLPFSYTRPFSGSIQLERSGFYASGVETIRHTLAQDHMLEP